MKTILTGNEAILAYEEIQGSLDAPLKCGYFYSDDCDHTSWYDKGTIIAFDNTDGNACEETFSNKNDAIEWINL